jgi:antitoxin MazE
MKAAIIKIGNSKGMRIPKSILEQCGFSDKAEIYTEGNKLIIVPLKARDGWEDSFKHYIPEKKQESFISNNWDNDKEWQW